MVCWGVWCRKKEIADYRDNKDPIMLFSNLLVSKGVLTEQDVEV